MDKFTRFNRKSIDDRKIDTLIGLAKGLTADNIINQAEAEFLYTWLIQNKVNSNHPVIGNLLSKVEAMLDDQILSADESQELLALLKKFTGDDSEIGELAKTTNLPIDKPAPTILFEGSVFVLTGQFAFGSRGKCEEKISFLGGKNAKNITRKTNYLVLGTYVTDSWAHETYGRKIEKAMEYRKQDNTISIITEAHWAGYFDFQ